MATTTPNFGWSVPTSSDLVKNGATAIETLGDSIDASLVDLKGGTTGQVLAKATNTDMDFTWTTSSAGMTNPMTTTGDTIYSSSGSTPARLGIGTTGQVLTVSGGVPTWATAGGGGGMTLLSTTTLSGTSTAISSISGAYNNLFVLVYGITGASAGQFRLNGDTTGVYASTWFSDSATTTQAIDNATLRWNSGNAVSGNITQAYTIYNYASTASVKPVSQSGGFMNTTTGFSNTTSGFKNTTSAITSITITSDGASFTAGTVLIYGVK
jgi:hypothetical protein